MKVGELEGRLLEMLPAAAAEPWDRTGMLVGDPDEPVRGVAVALDPTRAAIAFARGCGANVLLTHHPLFLGAPTAVKPAPHGDAVAQRIWDAVRGGVSVLSFHTALDASPRAAGVLAGPLGLKAGAALLQEVAGFPGYGYGRICEAAGLPVSAWADRCEAAFGRRPRLWGDPERAVRRICLWTGAAGDAPDRCCAAGVDLLVCGEVKYHAALDAAERGLSIVELGHDASEQPHCAVLLELAQEAGVPSGDLYPMGLPANWR